MQLDLFEPGNPRTAEVYPFPGDRLIGKARHTASTYRRCRSKRGADAYWTRTARAMAAQMRGHGFSPEMIDRELERFARAVSRELDILDKRARGA